MQNTLPNFVTQHFWGDNLLDLSWEKNQKYIIQTLLERGNIDSLSWLFSKINKKEVKEQLPNLKLSSKSANFWKVYLS